MKQYKYIIYLSASLIFLGCEDFLEKEPVDSIADQSAITDLKSAQAAVDGLYFDLNGLYSTEALLRNFGNLSDEQNDITGNNQYTLNSVQPDAISWPNSWTVISRANHIIKKVPEVQTISIENIDRFVSEAKFIRALEYLLLTQFWGDVPWTESTDFRQIQSLSRTPTPEVLRNIINDLLEAEQGLPVSYNEVGGSRARIVKGAATALLARTYLYQGNWAEAENKATEVINNSLYTLAPSYQEVFVANSNESILEFFFQDLSSQGITTAELFLTESLGGQYINVHTANFANAFEFGDLRKDEFINVDNEGLPYISKYNETGANQEVKILRLAEMYLIRAESRAQQGNVSGAAEDLNVLRSRADLANTTASDQASMLAAIEQERFVELCFEGHRWIDLVRTGRVDEVMSAFNPVGWQATDKLLPIPQSDIDLNPNLTQNPGY